MAYDPRIHGERPRQSAAVPGRGGQVPTKAGPKGTDMRTSRVTSDTTHYPVSRIAVSGGAFEGADETGPASTTTGERRRIQRANRKVYRKGARH